MTLIEFIENLPSDYYFEFDYWFESLSTQEQSSDDEYSYEGRIGDFESCMKGHDFIFNLEVSKLADVTVDTQAHKVYIKHLAYCD